MCTVEGCKKSYNLLVLKINIPLESYSDYPFPFSFKYAYQFILKRNPEQYLCSSFHSLIFHWFCYSLLLFKVSTTEPKLRRKLWSTMKWLFWEKKVSPTPSIPRDWWDTKTKAIRRERIFVLFPMMYYWHPGGIFSKT